MWMQIFTKTLYYSHLLLLFQAVLFSAYYMYDWSRLSALHLNINAYLLTKLENFITMAAILKLPSERIKM